MSSIKKKFVIIFGLLLIAIIIVVAIFEYLLNHGKFTHYIEQQINKNIDGRIKIGSVFLDMFSGIVLKDVSFNITNEVENLNFGCKLFAINSGILSIFNLNIKEIEIENMHFSLDFEGIKRSDFGTPSNEIDSFSILNDLPIPDKLNVDIFSITNINGQITADDYAIDLSETNIQIKELQTLKPISISLNSDMGLSERSDVESPIMSVKIDLNANYSLRNDELIINDNSNFLLSDNERFTINGKVQYLISKPELSCNLRLFSFPLSSVPTILKNFGFADISHLALNGESDTKIAVKGDMGKLLLKSNSLIKNLRFTYDNIAFSSKEFDIPAETIVFLDDPDGKIINKCDFFLPESDLFFNKNLITKFSKLPISFEMDYPKELRIDFSSILGDIVTDQQGIRIEELIKNVEIRVGLQNEENMVYSSTINTLFSDPVQIKGEYNYEKEVIKNSNIDLDNIKCATFFKKLNYLVPDDYKNWLCNGNVSFNTYCKTNNIDLDEINIINEFNFSDIQFASPDYDYFAEGINGDIKLDLKTNYDLKKIFCKLNGKFDPFLVSLGLFSTDMRDNETEIQFEGIFDTERKMLSDVNCTLFYENIGSLNLNGSLADVIVNPKIDLNVKIKDLSYANFFETFIKDTIEFSSPKFYNAQVSGTSNASFDLLGSMDSLQIDGNFIIEDGKVSVDDTLVEGLFIDFPFSITYPKSDLLVKKVDILEDSFGAIKIDKISHVPLEIDDFELNPLIESNNFFIKEPIVIPVFGGEFLVKDIFIEDLINPDRKLDFSFKLSDIDIEKVSTAANLTPFNGTLDTSLITFKQKGDTLFSDGEVIFSLFDGDVIINNLILTDFLSSLMGLAFSAKVNHLDLGKMSNTFQEWGNVSGIVNGNVNNFMIVAGEPYSFEIELKTKKERGIKQVVSANFLKSFVPGVGSALDTFGFTDYNYEVIGLQAKLENDYITFKGAVRDKGKELFMKGSGLKKLNIVFSNADKNIKFSRFLSSFNSIMRTNFEDTKIESE